GNFWIGTEGGGIGQLRAGKWAWFNRTNGLPSDNVFALYADREGILWAGTSSGLARCKNGVWTAFPDRPGLTHRLIGYLIEDDGGELWMGSNAGLMRASRKVLNELAD